MRGYGYLAANSGFTATEILAMTADDVQWWVMCLSLHFAWVNEQNR